MTRTTEQLAAYEAITARLDSIVNTLTGLGGSNDKGQAARPSTSRQPLSFDELDALWDYNGIARRIVEIIPSEACRKGWAVDVEEEEDVMAAWDATHDTRARVQDAWIWGRLYGDACLLLVGDDATEGWGDPWVPGTVVKNLPVFDGTEMNADAWNADYGSPAFRQVEHWTLSPSVNGTVDDPDALTRIHRTRLVHWWGTAASPSRLASRSGCHLSILDGVWDQVRDVTSLGQAGATIAQEMKRSMLKIQDLGALQVGDQAALVDAKIATIAKSMSMLNLLVLGDGDEFTDRMASINGMRDLSELAWGLLAAVTGMPMTLLRGDAPSGLNTDGASGQQNWGKVVRAIQRHLLEPRLRQIYDAAFASPEGPTGGQVPDSYTITFHPLDQPTEAEVADTELKQAQADEIAIRNMSLHPDEARRRRYPALAAEDPSVLDRLRAEEAAAAATAVAELGPLEG